MLVMILQMCVIWKEDLLRCCNNMLWCLFAFKSLSWHTVQFETLEEYLYAKSSVSP